MNTNFNRDNLTFHNDSCYASFDIMNLTGGDYYEFWMSIFIQECAANTSGNIINFANVTGTLAQPVSDSHTIHWDKNTTQLRITYVTEGINVVPIALAVLVLATALSVVLVAAIMLKKINWRKKDTE
jgi:hypothetical protein